jgi:PAS domain S-box-containing protein
MGACRNAVSGRHVIADTRYRALFDSVTDAVVIVTSDGVIVDANGRWEQTVMLPGWQLIGRRIHDLAATGHEEANETLILAGARNEHARTRRIALRRSDGATIYMDLVASAIDIGGEAHVLCVGSDVTERLYASQALEASKERYRHLIERISDAVWTADEAGTITNASPQIAHICGYTAGEMAGEDLSTRCERVHPADVGPVREAFAALLSDGKPFDLEYRCRRKDGAWVVVRNRAAMFYDPDGRRYAEGVLSDVSAPQVRGQGASPSHGSQPDGHLQRIVQALECVLSAILGNSGSLSNTILPRDPRRVDAEAIHSAAERGTALARRLLEVLREPEPIALRGRS